jgi:predicted O-methyltransferase YrrM
MAHFTNNAASEVPITVDFVTNLYRKYAKELACVRDAQRVFCASTKDRLIPQLDDLEAEITYLLLREFRPRCVVEIGTYHGWSTSWILSALRDNETGRLYSFDIIDNVLHNMPPELVRDRWTFRKGDIRFNLDALPNDIDYLFIDAAHNGRFARWYIAHLMPNVAPGTLASVHDVFHGRFALPFTEGATVLRWLKRTDTPYFTASAARAPRTYRQLLDTKKTAGLDKSIRAGHDNPMIFFHLP